MLSYGITPGLRVVLDLISPFHTGPLDERVREAVYKPDESQCTVRVFHPTLPLR